MVVGLLVMAIIGIGSRLLSYFLRIIRDLKSVTSDLYERS